MNRRFSKASGAAAEGGDGGAAPAPNASRALSASLAAFFRGAVRVSLPGFGRAGLGRSGLAQAAFFLRTVGRQIRAARLRSRWRARGIDVPPILIFSVTERCNLRCTGCYARALHQAPERELGSDEVERLLKEAQGLGFSFIVLAGGEPLVRRDILEAAARFPRLFFLVFTNGLLVDEEMLGRWKRQRNVIPVISLEGDALTTDRRRGPGVFARLQAVMESLQRRGVFFGVSVTLTRHNHREATGEQLVRELVERGSRLFFYAEYSPVETGDEDQLLDSEQRALIAGRIAAMRSRHRALFVSVPGDEEQFGGCLSAGRGFVHVSAGGDLEPCPFVPHSDTNLRSVPLAEALKSPLLRAIRRNPPPMEGGGGCALAGQADWIRSLME